MIDLNYIRSTPHKTHVPNDHRLYISHATFYCIPRVRLITPLLFSFNFQCVVCAATTVVDQWDATTFAQRGFIRPLQSFFAPLSYRINLPGMKLLAGTLLRRSLFALNRMTIPIDRSRSLRPFRASNIGHDVLYMTRTHYDGHSSWIIRGN